MANGESRLVAEEDKTTKKLFWLDYHSSEKKVIVYYLLSTKVKYHFEAFNFYIKHPPELLMIVGSIQNSNLKPLPEEMVQVNIYKSVGCVKNKWG